MSNMTYFLINSMHIEIVNINAANTSFKIGKS